MQQARITERQPHQVFFTMVHIFLKSLISKSVIEYEKNPNYWDKENVKIDNVKLTFYDGSVKNPLSVVSLQEHIIQRDFSQIVQVLLLPKRNMEIRLFIALRKQLVITLLLT